MIEMNTQVEAMPVHPPLSQLTEEADLRELVELSVVCPSVEIDLRYASSDNFTGKAVYPPAARCFLLKRVALSLSRAASSLSCRGLKLKVWDGYRSMTAQRLFWDACPDPRYVSPPEMGGRHTRGAAVDCTLVCADTLVEVDMGTRFDDFSTMAHRDYADLPSHVLDNRRMLEDVMRDNGFIGLATEWWHFDYEGWEECAPLDADMLSGSQSPP
eukprot:TRINITY_DN5104_c0_g1_i1.p1 TRINITY_DN5104_c0_g1~~TRINITY_DN5104_c0_g1_i1.p1  ORF type:complete len:214 (+),score=34.98 TRINITY_DN5104_c0_g1_i1:194-835(+)